MTSGACHGRSTSPVASPLERSPPGAYVLRTRMSKAFTKEDDGAEAPAPPPEEQRLLGEGCSVKSPLGRALLGATEDDEREVALPRGNERYVIEKLEGEAG